MAVPVSGNFAQISIAQLFAAIASGRVTGALTVNANQRHYVLWWNSGHVVDAESTAPEDQLGRVLLAAKMINMSQLSESIQRMAKEPGLSQLQLLVKMKALSRARIDQAARMGLVQRVLRTFSFPDADYRIQVQKHERSEGGPLNARWAIYHGMHQYFDEARFVPELARFNAASIGLKDLPRDWIGSFGFGGSEQRVIGLLAQKEWTLDQLRNEVPDAKLNATLVALYVTGGLAVTRGQPITQAPGRQPPIAIQPSAPRPGPSLPKPKPVVPRTTPASPTPAQTSSAPKFSRDDVLKKHKEVTTGADHFRLLGLAKDASAAEIKTAYFALAKLYHPDRLAAHNLVEMRPQVERIFARISDAFSVLNDDKKRKEYLGVLDQGGEEVVKKRVERETALAMKILSAEDSFLEGEMALRHQAWQKACDHFAKAIKLNPDEGEHHAAFAWASWCAATAKEGVLQKVKAGINKGLLLNPKCAPAYFYMGQVLKQTGDDAGAERQFRRALAIDPDHRESGAEIRIIEMRRRR